LSLSPWVAIWHFWGLRVAIIAVCAPLAPVVSTRVLAWACPPHPILGPVFAWLVAGATCYQFGKYIFDGGPWVGWAYVAAWVWWTVWYVVGAATITFCGIIALAERRATAQPHS
jgi:hypothetical protein